MIEVGQFRVSKSPGQIGNRLQMTQMVTTSPGGSPGNLMTLNYSYQANAGQLGTGTTPGNTGQLMSVTGTMNGQTESAAYTYDLNGRLVTTSQTSNGASAQRRFTYDRWGNRTGEWDATSGGNQLQNITLQQSGGAPTNGLATISSAGESVYNTPGQCGTPTTVSVGRTGRYVRVQLMGTNYLHLAEVQVIGTSGQNLALGKTASQSSTVLGATASRANDGNTDGNFADGSVSHTDFQNQPWWQVDLGSSQQITSVSVWNRTDCCQSRTSNFNVIVSDQPITTVGCIYDAVGNVTFDGAHSYAYDAENRLVSVDAGATAKYYYDFQSRRVKKISAAGTTHYVWEGGKVLSEHDGNTGSALADYIYSGTALIAKVAGGVTNYFVTDRLSVRMAFDTSGNVVGRQAHLPFGEDFAESGQQEKHHFTSYEEDPETGADYAVNRFCAASACRFMSADPYKQSGYMVDPQSWNRYTYTGNDPINFVDYAGLFRSPYSNDPNPGGIISVFGLGGGAKNPLRNPFDNGAKDPTEGPATLKILPIPLDLGARIAARLSIGGCASFTKNLIDQAAKDEGVPFYSDSVLDLYAAISGPGGGGYKLKENLTVAGKDAGGTVEGSMGGLGSDDIALRPTVILRAGYYEEGSPPAVISFLQSSAYVLPAIHETIHLAASRGVYDDIRLAKAVFEMLGPDGANTLSQDQIAEYNNIKPGTNNATFRASGFWEGVLKQNCP
jgi:RHS repeat-associated protein